MPVAGISSGGEVGIQILAGKDDESQGSNSESSFPDKVCQFGELDIQRSLFFALFGCLAGHFSDFSGIAYLIYTHDAVSVGNSCSSHNGIRRVSGFFVEMSFIHRFVDHQLSGQTRFVDL